MAEASAPPLEDPVCQICLQLLVQPSDTPCGHTYCQACLASCLLESNLCPVCHQPLKLQNCVEPGVLMHKMMDELAVTCPATQVQTPADLEESMNNR